MSEIKWIKLQTDIFDNRKIKQLERLPDGDTLIVIWLKILVLAGTVNDGGLVYFTQDIPYTDQLLATEFNRPLPTVQLALKTFQQFGMIEIIDNLIHVSNWERYQNIEGLEKVREQNRLRQKRWYDKQKLLPEPNVIPNVSLTLSNAIDKELEEEKDKIQNTNSFSAVVEAWNGLGLGQVRRITGERERLLKARIKEYGEEGVLEAIGKIKDSDFLQGHGSKGWTITFDWFLGPRNFAKVLEGNYSNKKEERNPKYMSSGKATALSSEEWDKVMNSI